MEELKKRKKIEKNDKKWFWQKHEDGNFDGNFDSKKTSSTSLSYVLTENDFRIYFQFRKKSATNWKKLSNLFHTFIGPEKPEREKIRRLQENEGVIVDDGNFVGTKPSLYPRRTLRGKMISVSTFSFEKYELQIGQKLGYFSSFF